MTELAWHEDEVLAQIERTRVLADAAEPSLAAKHFTHWQQAVLSAASSANPSLHDASEQAFLAQMAQFNRPETDF